VAAKSRLGCDWDSLLGSQAEGRVYVACCPRPSFAGSSVQPILPHWLQAVVLNLPAHHSPYPPPNSFASSPVPPLTPSVFDKTKLSWMNGQHLRALPEEEMRAMIGGGWAASGLLARTDSPFVAAALALVQNSLELVTGGWLAGWRGGVSSSKMLSCSVCVCVCARGWGSGAAVRPQHSRHNDSVIMTLCSLSSWPASPFPRPSGANTVNPPSLPAPSPCSHRRGPRVACAAELPAG
jgi:hypothetical protein